MNSEKVITKLAVGDVTITIEARPNASDQFAEKYAELREAIRRMSGRVLGRPPLAQTHEEALVALGNMRRDGLIQLVEDLNGRIIQMEFNARKKRDSQTWTTRALTLREVRDSIVIDLETRT